MKTFIFTQFTIKLIKQRRILNTLKCLYAPPLWLLVTNRLSWSIGVIFIIIALVEIVGQVAIKEKVFTKNIKIILLIMSALILIGLITTSYFYYAGAHFNSGGLNC